MYYKWIGAALIISSCSCFGFSLALHQLRRDLVGGGVDVKGVIIARIVGHHLDHAHGGGALQRGDAQSLGAGAAQQQGSAQSSGTWARRVMSGTALSGSS